MDSIREHKNKIIAAALLLFAGIWLVFIEPGLRVQYPSSFSYTADLISVDNFYSEEHDAFEGEQLSASTFSYNVVDTYGNVQIIENTFDVRTLNGEPIISITREYAIDSKTGVHVSGFGDKDRDGYLFAPQGLRSDAPFVYWHINYDAPAAMAFVNETDVYGLRTLVYESTYDGHVIDQTDNLGHLPGVPEERGVRLDPRLRLWIEPETGMLVKYADETEAYYYDQQTNERLVPWNTFRNTYTKKSVQTNVSLIQQQIITKRLQQIVFPVFLIVFAAWFLARDFLRRHRPTKDQQHVVTQRLPLVLSALVFVGSTLVIGGWVYNINILKSLLPGLVTMKFTTALSFLISAVIVFFISERQGGRKDLAAVTIPVATLILFLLMGTLLTSVLFGITSGLETLFIPEREGAIFTAVPGRPSIGTMVNFLLIGAAGLTSLFMFTQKPRVYTFIGRTIVVIASIALVGFLLNMPVLYYTIPKISTGMALHTALFFFALGVALQYVSRTMCVDQESV